MPLFIFIYSFVALALTTPVLVSHGQIDLAVYITIFFVAVNAFVFIVERRGKG